MKLFGVRGYQHHQAVVYCNIQQPLQRKNDSTLIAILKFVYIYSMGKRILCVDSSHWSGMDVAKVAFSETPILIVYGSATAKANMNDKPANRIWCIGWRWLSAAQSSMPIYWFDIKEHKNNRTETNCAFKRFKVKISIDFSNCRLNARLLICWIGSMWSVLGTALFVAYRELVCARPSIFTMSSTLIGFNLSAIHECVPSKHELTNYEPVY